LRGFQFPIPKLFPAQPNAWPVSSTHIVKAAKTLRAHRELIIQKSLCCIFVWLVAYRFGDSSYFFARFCFGQFRVGLSIPPAADGPSTTVSQSPRFCCGQIFGFREAVAGGGA